MASPESSVEIATPIAWARRLLEATGWAVRERPAGSSSMIAVKAQRRDEIGRSTGLWLALADGGDAEVPGSLALRLPPDGSTRGALIVSGRASEEMRAAAERYAIEVWSAPEARAGRVRNV